MNIIPRVHGSSHISPNRCALPPVLRTEPSDFERWCVEAFFARTGTKDGASDFRLVLRRDPALPEESYRLTVTERAVTVAASTERGAVWALTTAASCSTARGISFPSGRSSASSRASPSRR